MIELKHACVQWTSYGCLTRFKDGTEVGAYPHDTPHYHVVAHRFGYGDDLLSYAREHDLLHSLVAEWLFDSPSPVLQGVARGSEVSGPASAYEECFVQAMQAFLRANQRPILSGLPNLDEWKRQALGFMEAEERGFDGGMAVWQGDCIVHRVRRQALEMIERERV